MYFLKDRSFTAHANPLYHSQAGAFGHVVEDQQFGRSTKVIVRRQESPSWRWEKSREYENDYPHLGGWDKDWPQTGPTLSAFLRLRAPSSIAKRTGRPTRTIENDAAWWARNCWWVYEYDWIKSIRSNREETTELTLRRDDQKMVSTRRYVFHVSFPIT